MRACQQELFVLVNLICTYSHQENHSQIDDGTIRIITAFSDAIRFCSCTTVSDATMMAPLEPPIA